MTAAESLGQLFSRHGWAQRCARGDDDTRALQDKGAVEFGDLLHDVVDGVVQDVPLLFGVALEGVDASFNAGLLDLLVVTDDEQGTDGLALSALVCQLEGEPQHLFEHGPSDMFGQLGLTDRLEEFVLVAHAHGHECVDGSPRHTGQKHKHVPGLEKALGEGDEGGHFDLAHSGQVEGGNGHEVGRGVLGSLLVLGVAADEKESRWRLYGLFKSVDVVHGVGVGEQDARLHGFGDLRGRGRDGHGKVGVSFGHRLLPLGCSVCGDTCIGTILIGMLSDKLGSVCFVFAVPCFAALAAALHAGQLEEPPVPSLSKTHRVYLSRVARRTVRDVALKRERYELDYVPVALERLNGEVVVRLRQRGCLLATAAAGPSPVAKATRDAALTAVQMLSAKEAVDLDRANRMLIEIEVVGPSQPIPVEADWTKPRAVDPFVEPGVHGLVLIGATASHRFCPTEILVSDLVVADALRRFAESVHVDPSRAAEVKLSRFRTVHWYEPESSGEVVSLHRGLTIVDPSAVTLKQVGAAIDRLAEYMAYRQLESGLFAYQYDPGRDAYADEENLVRQAGAVVAMAVHARVSGKGSSRAAAELGIRFHLQGITQIPGVEEASYIATSDGRNKLGITALLCLAMAEHSHPEHYAAVREDLINGMLWLQRPSGMFLTAFRPEVEVQAQDYFPGEALLAMAAHYRLDPSVHILEAFHRAISFYREYFRGRPSPAFVPWQVQAYTLMAEHSKRRDYVDYVFELADWLADKQLNRDNCRWAELWGGFATYQPGRVGVATAAYLEGFADALKLARAVNDAERAQRYEGVVREAVRFVMQLQIRPEEAYYIRSPRDAVGGIRTSPSLNLLRIDHCQHALIGLIKARQVLFSDQG